jgi:arylsulfatase A-like enzyme
VCPTLCELAGAAAPADIHGRSLVPILTSRRQTHRDNLLFAYRDFQRGIRAGRHVALWYPKIDRWQLFDLRDDPDQLHDLSAIPAHAETLRSLRARLATLRQEFGDNQKLP